MRYARTGALLATAIALGVGAIVAVAFEFGLWRSASPLRVADVPLTIPTAGVDVDHQVLLHPLATGFGRKRRREFLSEGQALRRAHKLGNAPGLTHHALLASVTMPGMKLYDFPAWIVTFTSPHAHNVRLGCAPGERCPPLLARRNNFVLDAVTGKFMFGFFTP